jgi:hypothetical protein
MKHRFAGALAALGLLLAPCCAVAADQTPLKQTGTPAHPTAFGSGDTVGVPHGGTGVTVLTTHCVVVGQGAAVVHLVCPSSAGQVLTDNGAGADPTFQAPATNGTVTSAGLTPPSVETCTGSPVTVSGTIVCTLNTESAHTFLAGPTSGSPATPAFRVFGLSDLPSIGAGHALGNCTGSSAAPQDCGLSALLDQAIGSTQGDILYRGASAWAVLAPGTIGQVLNSGGAGANPVWGNSAGGTGAGLFWQIMSPTPTQALTGLSNISAGNTSTDSSVGQFIGGSTGQSFGYTTTVPATPYSIVALVVMEGGAPGLGWTDGTKIQFIFHNNGATDPHMYVQAYSNPTTFSATSATGSVLSGTTVWVKIRDDGTNVYFSDSVDGVNFTTIYQVAKASGFLGATGYSHIFAGSVSGGRNATIMSWTQGS